MDKLLEFQKKVGAIKKDSVNPFYKSKYADINSLLDVVKPLLNEVGLLAVQPLEIREGKNALITKIFDGDKVILESAIIIPDNIDPQKIGSAITYYRRYSLQALFLLEAEDDDAESSKPEEKGKGWKEKYNYNGGEATNQKAKEMVKPELDSKIVNKIRKAKTPKELTEIYTELSEDEKPNYLDELGKRKTELNAKDKKNG